MRVRPYYAGQLVETFETPSNWTQFYSNQGHLNKNFIIIISIVLFFFFVCFAVDVVVVLLTNNFLHLHDNTYIICIGNHMISSAI